MKGIEKDGRIHISKLLLFFGFWKLRGIVSNYWQIRPFDSKGSIMTMLFASFSIFLKFFKYNVRS